MQVPSEHLDPSLLREHERFLRELSTALVRGSSDAEDVAQETRLAALEKPPRGNARAWIARVVRGLAARRWRDEERRTRRERRAARPEELPSSSELVQRAESSRALLAVILELEEPYRSTVMLRYFEGHLPRVIAEAHGVAEGTVHVRLHRAFCQLRVRLDRDGGRERWMSALAPFALALPERTSATSWSWVAMKAIPAKSLVLVGLLLFLVALAPLAWWVFTSRGLVPQETDLRAAVPGGETARGRAASEDASLVRAESPATTEAGAAIDPAARNALFQIVVIDAESKEPIPGARVFWLDRSRHHFAFSSFADWPQLATRRLGTEDVADDAGVARITPASARAYVVPEHDRKWGFVELHPGMSMPVRVAIEPYHEVEIQVVDGVGRSVPDVPVALVTPPGVYHRGAGSHLGCWRGRTGPDGTALARYSPSAFQGDRRPLTLRATFAVASLHREGVEFPLADPPREPLRLLRPAWGKVIVDVEDPEGRPLREEVMVLMSWSHAEAQREGSMCWGGGSRTTDSGRAVFDDVGLGLDLTFTVWNQSGWKDLAVEEQGPRKDGEEVRVRARLIGRAPMLRGRVVHPDGRAVADCELQAVIRTPDSHWWSHEPVQLDGEGRFRVPLDWTPSDGARLILELIQWSTSDGAGLPNGPLARADIPLEIERDGRDLGDLVLEPQAQPFAGTVRDDRGGPIAGAEIRVRPVVLEGEDPQTVERIDRLSARTNAAGRYECRGPWPTRDCMLRVEADGHALAMHGPVAPGSKQIEIALARGGALEGRVLIEPELPIEELTLFAGGDHNARAARAVPDPEGRFRMEGVAPGTRALSVMFEHKELARIERIEIRTAETTRDPRIDPLDLRGHLERRQFNVREARGRRLESAFLRSTRAGVHEWARGIHPDAEGRVELFLPRSESELWVGAAGCLPVRLDRDRDPCSATLRRGPRVRIVANAPLEKVHHGGESTHAVLRVAETDADPTWQAYCEELGEIELNAHGQGLVDLPRAGRYVFAWPELQGFEKPFEVLDLSEEQTVRVALPWDRREIEDR